MNRITCKEGELRMPHGVKIGNEYAGSLTAYSAIPKSVLAAVAVSFAMRLHGEGEGIAEAAVLDEWRILHVNGIVPQKPIATKEGTND